MHTEEESPHRTEYMMKRYNVERAYYQGRHPFTYEEVNEAALNHKTQLQEARNEISSKIKELDPLEKALRPKGKVLSSANQQTLKDFNDGVRRFCEFSVERLSCVLVDLFKTSESMLSPAPCRYAVIAVGSLARGEFSPYSDLEYMFAIESNDHRAYFHQMAVDTYFRLGNLEETPLKYMDIAELCNEAGSCWFNVHSHSNGLKIDGLQRQAGNIPTGNGRLDGFPLIFTRSEIERIQSHSRDHEDVLSCQGFICGSENFYLDIRQTWRQCDLELRNQRQGSRIDELCKAVLSFDFLPMIEFARFTRQAAAKRDIFRFASLLILYLRNIFCIDTCNPWEVIEVFREKYDFSAVNVLCLKFLVSSATFVRSSAYLHYQSQRDLILHAVSDDDGRFYSLPDNLAFSLSCLLTPIKLTFTECLLQAQTDKDILRLVKLSDIEISLGGEAVSYFQIGMPDKALEILDLQNDYKLNDASITDRLSVLTNTSQSACDMSAYHTATLLQIAVILSLKEDLTTASEILNNLQQNLKVAIDNSEHPSIKSWQRKFLSKVLICLSMTERDRGDIDSALDHAQKSWDIMNEFPEELSSPDSFSVLAWLGFCATHNKHYSLGLQYLQQAVDGLQVLLNKCNEHEYDTICFRLVQAELDRAQLYHNMPNPDYPQALLCAQQALQIFRSRQVNTGSSLEALILRPIGDAYRMLGKPNDAKKHLNKALKFCRQDKIRSQILNSLGDLFHSQKDFTSAIESYNQSLDAGSPGHPEDTVRTLLALGRCSLAVGNIDAAISSFEKAQNLNHQSDDQQFKAEVNHHLAEAWYIVGDTLKSHQYLVQAECAGKNLCSSHPIIPLITALKKRLEPFSHDDA